MPWRLLFFDISLFVLCVPWPYRFPLPNQANTTSVPLNPETGSYFFPQPPGGTRLQVVGGHHDAGDYGKYVINSGTFVGWLMASLDVLGVDNDDLPLPEAGDGIPDIVQVCWGCSASTMAVNSSSAEVLYHATVTFLALTAAEC